MIVKVLPIENTTMRVWENLKYYPGVVHEVDDALGEVLIKRRIAVKVDAPPKKSAVSPPFRRGPGRPRKNFV